MINVRGLTKDFGEVKVLKGIDQTIEKGEKLVIIGPSGSGKSTFLRCLNRLEEPTSGTIEFEGIDITSPKCNINHVRRKMGMVFQQFNLFPHKTVLENIMLAPVHLKLLTKSQAQDKAMTLLKRVGLEEKAKSYPAQLSGGQKQRIAIVRALAMDPDVMLFDEPTSALDPELTGEVLKVIRSLADQETTMIIVTHEMAFARDVSKRVIFMANGVIVEDRPPKELFEEPKDPLTREFLSRFRNA